MTPTTWPASSTPKSIFRNASTPFFRSSPATVSSCSTLYTSTSISTARITRCWRSRLLSFMKPNTVKQALAEGKVQLGCGFGQLRSQDVVRILRDAGFHWAFVDTEHGGFDLETVQDLCRISAFNGFCPVVRVAELQYSLVTRALDAGAQGIMFPRVESPEILEKAISWTKYPPLGVRGFG